MKKIFLLSATIFCLSHLTQAQSGHLDSSFGDHGVVKTNLGKSYPNGVAGVNHILLQPNGNIYVIRGSFITKRHSDGSVDSSFGGMVSEFVADAGFAINKAVIQPDGKIVAVGSVILRGDSLDQSDFALARFNVNGSPDSSFSGDGKQTTEFGDGSFYSDDYANSVALQKDGKIIVAGRSNGHPALARYSTNGSLDSTFDGDGLLTNNLIKQDNEFAASIVVQNDGKILIAGGFTDIIRYNANGSLDETFKAEIARGFIENELASIQNDGKIITVNYSPDGIALIRYNTNGSLDSTFSNNGRRKIYSPITSLALQGDGKIVAASDDTLARYNTDGSADSTFSANGKQADFYSRFYSIAIESDGKIIAADAYRLSRYNEDGSLDETFGKNGKSTVEFYLGKTTFTNTAIQKDGKIITTGRTWNGSMFVGIIVRYKTDGSIDSLFGHAGAATTEILSDNDFSSPVAAIQSDGKIIAAQNYKVFRYNSDGSLDSGFSGSGYQINIRARSIAVQKDGKILVAGGESFTTNYGVSSNPVIARFKADGSLDKTFGLSGKQTIVLNSKYGDATSVLIQNDGKIVAAGVFGGNTIGNNTAGPGPVILIRLNTDGSLDTTFGSNGLDNFAPYHWSLDCSIIMQKDGRIITAANDVTHYHGIALYRLNNDGSLDNSFKTIPPFQHINFPANRASIALENNGKIVVSGSDLLRYNTDGTLDSTFNINAKQEVDFDIQDIAVANNKLYAVGGTYYGSVARYLVDSSNTPPTVSITTPTNNLTRLAPAAHIKLSAVASDQDGTITKVEFYNGTKLLHTETVFPYGYVWKNVPVGNYTITAKAYDNSGNVTTSAAVHISVVANKAPVVSIISPANNQTYADTATIRFEAAASDTDGRITRIEFYNGTTLLRTEYKYPYTYNWTNVAAGTYTITAKATDNFGAQTTSAAVTVTVTGTSIVSNRLYSKTEKDALNNALSLRLSPNPANNIVNIHASGLQQKPATLSIISVSGIVLKTMLISNAATQLDVSSLVSGVYTLKIACGNEVKYKQFVKL